MMTSSDLASTALALATPGPILAAALNESGVVIPIWVITTAVSSAVKTVRVQACPALACPCRKMFHDAGAGGSASRISLAFNAPGARARAWRWTLSFRSIPAFTRRSRPFIRCCRRTTKPSFNLS